MNTAHERAIARLVNVLDTAEGPPRDGRTWAEEAEAFLHDLGLVAIDDELVGRVRAAPDDDEPGRTAAKVALADAVLAQLGEQASPPKPPLTPDVVEQLQKVAATLKKVETCMACDVEAQAATCNTRTARWGGREILRILSQLGAVIAVELPAALLTTREEQKDSEDRVTTLKHDAEYLRGLAIGPAGWGPGDAEACRRIAKKLEMLDGAIWLARKTRQP